MMIKKLTTCIIEIGLVILLSVLPVLAEGEVIPIETIVASSTTHPANPAGYLVDGDYSSGWTLLAGATEGWTELSLQEEAVIYGLDLTGLLGADTDLRIEFQHAGQWIPFTAPVLHSLPAGQIIDLSYDRVLTDCLRLVLTGGGASQSVLTELRVYGEQPEPFYRRILPVAISASANTSPVYRAEFLSDDNTYTSWQLESAGQKANSPMPANLLQQLTSVTGAAKPVNPAKPGDGAPMLTGQVVFQLDQPYQLDNINIYFVEAANGEVIVEAATDGSWLELERLSANDQHGWYRLNVHDYLANGVLVDQVRLTLQGNGAMLGGISEVHLWGAARYCANQQILIGMQNPTALQNTPINRYFDLGADQVANYTLELGIQEETSDSVMVELNGKRIILAPSFTIRGQTIYRLQVDAEKLWAGTNYLKILPGVTPLTLITARLVQFTPDGTGDLFDGKLNDGWLLTPGDGNNAESELALTGPTLLEELRVFTEATNSFIYASAWVEGSWQPLQQTGWKGHWVRFTGPALTERIRISNLSGFAIGEVEVLGSITSNHEPVVQILSPEDGAILDFSGSDEDYLAGFVDNPAATVTVNGKKTTQSGHFFWTRLSILKDSPWKEARLTASAVDTLGRQGTDVITVIWGDRSLLTIDQPLEVVYTNAESYQISGTARTPLSEVEVNGIKVALTPPAGIFAVQVPLVDGFNLITIKARQVQDAGEEKFVTAQERKVIRCSEPVKVSVNSPVSGTYTAKDSVVVTGTVEGLGAVQVSVNGQSAQVNGMFFTSQPVVLAEGSNTIVVEVADISGTCSEEITVYKDTASPGIAEVVPVEGLLFNTSNVEITGKVFDQSPVWLYINGQARVLTGNAFQEVLNFHDGARQIVLKAQDMAGNVASHTVNLTIDTTAPEAFEVTADPAVWTNNTQPVLTFSTTDQTSGVDHYEFSIDGGESQMVTSPYRLAHQSEGEHEIAVAAVDQAGWRRIATTKIYIDTTPPETPAYLRVIPGADSAEIRWDAPAAEDVIEYHLVREHAGESEEVTINSGTVYFDPDLTTGEVYTYRVWAVDRAYNASEPTEWQEGTIGLAVTPYVPGEGAVVEYEGVNLAIPKEGLPEGIAEIRVTEVTSEVLEEKCLYPVIGPIYEFAAYKEGSDLPEDVLPLEQGYLASIQYDDSLIPAGFPEQNLGVYHYDPMFDRWFLIPSAGVDVENNVIYFLANHFSSFSVQATVMQDLTPQEYKDAGHSPLKTYSVHEGVAVSPQGGTASTQVTELVLPGRNGFDFVLSRRYDTATARSDAFSLAINGSIGFNLLGPGGDLLSFEEILASVEGLKSADDWANGQMADGIRNIIEQYLFNQGDFAYSMGQGWRLNIPYIKSANSSVMISLPDGTMHSINEMLLIDAVEKGATSRTLMFEQHEGADFTLLVHQSKSVDVVNALVGGNFLKTRWYGLGYKLILKDGTVYEMDSLGRTTRMIDPTGLNTVTFHYSLLELDYIQDSLGRRIRFSYNNNLLWSRINRIWVENDSYARQINYDISNETLLVQATDAGGRVSSYEYDFRLLFGGEVGAKFNILTMLAKVFAGPVAGLVGSVFGVNDVELYGRVQVQAVMPMNKMEAPGQGIVGIDYIQKTYVYGNCEVEGVIGIPVSITLSLNMEQRLLATGVNIYLSESSTPVRQTTYTYDMENALLPYLGQPFVGETVEDDGKRRIVYTYTPVWKERYRWEDKSATVGNSPIEVTFPTVLLSMTILPINTSTAVYDAENGALVELQQVDYDTRMMRPIRSTVWHGSNYRRLEYAYDNWGNVIYTDDRSVTNGRTNDVQSWMCYLNTSLTAAPGVTWKTSPYTQGAVNSNRRNLLAGTVTANMIPAADGGTSIQYLHTYNHYNTSGQLIGQAQWNGTDWSQTTFEYNPDGTLHRQVNPVGHETVYNYDEHGLLASVVEKDIIDAAGQSTDIITHVGHEYISGWKLWSQDPRGYVTHYEYDSLGRVTGIIGPDDDDENDWLPGGSVPEFRQNNPTTVIAYDDVNLSSEVVNPLGQRVSYDYDLLGRLVELAKYQRVNGEYVKASVTTLRYDAWGNITSITDPNGNAAASPVWEHTTWYDYDSMGRNTGITYPDETENLSDNARRVLAFDYTNDKLTTTDEEVNITEEYYDMQGRVIRQIVYNGMQEIEVENYYDGLGNLIWTVGPKDRTAPALRVPQMVNEYNDLNLLKKVTYPEETFWEGGIEVEVTPYTRFEYNAAGQKIKQFVSMPANREQETDYAVDGLGRVIRTTVKYVDGNVNKQAVSEVYYDGNGNKVRLVDANNTPLSDAEAKAMTFTYSAVNLVLTETDLAGNTTSYTYDAAGNRISMTDPRGNSGSYTEDFTIIYEYDDLNRLVKGYLPKSVGENAKPVVSLLYDARGNLVERNEPDGAKTSYTYYPRNWVKTATVEGSGQAYTTRYYYDRTGNQTEVEDARGNTTLKEYDALKRLTRVEYPEGNAEQFEYDIYGNQTVHVDGLANWTEYSYDLFNHLKSVRDPLGTYTTYRYDRLGNMTQMTNVLGDSTTYTYDDLNRLLRETDAQEHETRYSYDAVGNRLSSTDPNGTVGSYEYYPNYLVKSVTLTNGDRVQMVEYTYDEAGFVTTATDGSVVSKYNVFDDVYHPDPFNRVRRMTRELDGQEFTVEYTYDLLGRVTGVRSPAGEWVNYNYNNLGQLLSVPGYIDQAPVYDAGGLLETLTAANGVTQSWEYDANGRLTGLNYANQSTVIKEYVLTYDAANNIVARNQDTFQYDCLNQLILANLHGKFEISPDEEEQQVGRVLGDYQGQSSLEWSVDNVEVIELDYAAGSIGVDLEAPVMVSRIELTPDSPVHRVDATDLAVLYSLDNYTYTEVMGWQMKQGALGELMIALQTPVQARYVKVKSYFDDRDAAFEPVNAAEFTNNPDELIKVYYYTTERTEYYSYDNLGNRLSQTITQRYAVSQQYSYYPDSNQMKTNGKYGFAYDANGNLVAKGRHYSTNETSVTLYPEQGDYWEYEYDLMNRLTQVTRDGVIVAEYTYDANGLRLKKEGSGKTTYYIFGLNGEVLYKQENQQYLEYIYVLGTHFARVDGDLAGGETATYFYHTDHLGSAVLVTDGVGEVVWSSEYTPFGQLALEQGVLAKAAKFTGKDLDADTGLYYFNARWYDAEMGRFITLDPLRDGLNWYGYTQNSPICYIDYSGTVPIVPLLLKAGVGGSTDLLMQATFSYIFDPEVNSAKEAFEKVNWWQVVRSSGEAVLPWKIPGGKVGKAAASATVDVLVNAADSLSKGVEYTEEQAINDFALGFIGDLTASQIGEFVEKYGAVVVAKGLKKVGIGDALIKDLTGVDLVNNTRIISFGTEKVQIKLASGKSFLGGDSGENYLLSVIGGDNKVNFITSIGRREVDVLVNGIAYESKVGFVNFSSLVEKQIIKDAELMKVGAVKGVVWNFFRSEITGKIGANQRVLNLLDYYNIPYVIHE